MIQKRTEKQIAASRANGAKSRGPATKEGLRISRSGRSSATMLVHIVVREGESRKSFRALEQILISDLQPQSAVEHLLVGRIAAAHWRQIRTWQKEKESSKENPAAEQEAEMRFDRQFFRSLDRFFHLRLARHRLKESLKESLRKDGQPGPGE